MVVVAIVALLATIAVPAYLDHVRKARRADAITRMSQVQQAQERWRANSTTYATSASLGIATTTPDGYYTVSATNATGTGYQVLAAATGAQASDTNCRYLQLTMSGGNVTLASGPTTAVNNAETANKRCWNR